VEYLANRARSFIFSTAPLPAAAAAARAAIQLATDAEGDARREIAWRLANDLKQAADIAGLKLGAPASLIMPLALGEEARAMAAAADLLGRGIFVPAIRYPTVARGAARLRVTLTAAHTAEDVGALAEAFALSLNPKS
jgi:7-keto-8-aminopelargonate synthetase-like enzyme